MLKPLIVSALFWPCILLGETGSEVSRLKPAAKLIAEKGVLKPKEILVWSGPEKPAVGWQRLDNQYFQIDYPDCYDMWPSGEESNPNKAVVIELGSKKCPSAGVLGVSVGRRANMVYRSINDATSENEASRQKLTINGIEALLLVDILNKRDAEKNRIYQLRWEAYVMCSGEMFSIGAMINPGKESHDRIEKNNYGAPEDFRRIASTFRCSKRRLPK